MLQTQPTTITQKGQVTIPAKVRQLLRLRTGDQIKFTVGPGKEVKIKPVKRFSIMNLYGSLKPKVKYTAKDDIYKIIREEEQTWPRAAAERDQRTMRESKRKK